MTPNLGNVTVQELSAALIHQFEGCKLQAYLDSGGVWTIGYGHTGPEIDHTTVWTQQQADDQLAKDQAHLFAMVANIKSIEEAAALVSFGYNCGAGALQRVLDGQDMVSDPKHTTDRLGHILPGLVARRRLEETLIALGQQKS